MACRSNGLPSPASRCSAFQPEMPPDAGRRHASARRALQVALLDQVGFQHVLDGVARFADGGGEVVHADRAAAEFFQHGAEQLAVHDIEAEVVDVEHGQRRVGDGARDLAVGLDLGEVAHAAQQAVGNARRAARALGDFHRAVLDDVAVQQVRRAAHDQAEFFRRVELQPGDDAEAVAQRVGQHAGARGGADQGEGRQVELDRARRGAFADHDVDLEILQRRVEDFLDHGARGDGFRR
jgi:hypothetical protein